ncbi:MAG: TonB-dependent receptor plug domain-containing protein [Halioglobus sp.]|nr:TonB-dependent receptor plug domain-containing protein [Halioglobus sp.]
MEHANNPYRSPHTEAGSIRIFGCETSGRCRLGPLVLLLAAGFAQPALAQTAPANKELEQVIVYGSRTSSALEDSLSSIGIVSREDIEDMDLRSFRETFRILANVMDSDWVDGGFIIRGINSEGLTPGGNPLASLYIDGVQQTVNGARRGSRGVWDVEQVEVYRGPQSTLSGRAALAGAVYIKTRDPGFEWDASVRGLYGTDDLAGGAFAVGGPLIDNQLAFRLAGEYETSEFGDIKYPTYTQYNRYDDYVKDEYYQVRGKLLYLPQNLPDTRALVSFSTAEDSPAPRDIAGPVLGFDYDDQVGEVNDPVYAEPRNATNNNAAVELNHSFDPALRFTSLSTWSDSNTDRPSINKGTPGETEVTRGKQRQELITQELRLNYDGESLSGTAGLYYADDQSDLYSTRNAYGREDISKGHPRYR